MALAGAFIFPQAASAVSLKQTSVVDGDTVTLGDVFTGLSSNTEKVLGIAPQPGQEMVLNARTLLRIAVALDLPWRPASAADQVVVTRAASIIDRDMIDSALRAELESKGVSGKYQVVIPDSAAKIVLAPEIEPSIVISSMNFVPETGRFEADAVAPSLENPAYRTKIIGTIHKLVDVPVLHETLNAGSIINERDIDYIEIKESDVRPDMILSAETMIGMTPRRVVMSGKPLKTIDILAPQIIARGDTVTMMFKSGALTLTASGKALENGAKGDLIRVLNPNGNTTIEGFVTASREVTVKSF